MNIKTITFLFLSLFFISFGMVNPPYGIDEANAIGPYLNEVFPKKSPSFGSWKATNAFPNLTFSDPIAMLEIPGEDAYYIAGKEGYIWLIDKDENTTEKITALDLSNNVITSGDAGLINFVLHPEFGISNSDNKNYLYLFYAFHPSVADGEDERMNRLSRFSVIEGTLMIDPDSEFILFQDFDPQGWHMGGGMFFDDKGFLYFTTGDGGWSHDALNSGQQIDKRLWGGIFRIDVDNDQSRSHPIRRQTIEYPEKPADLPATFSQGYMIPNDNPWQDENGGIMEEFFGLGLRSPHRASFDPVENEIWIADVGQSLQEEITILPKGGNAQWPYKEGTDNGPRGKPETIIGVEVPPVYEYDRSDGNAIIGGFVYRGSMWEQYFDGLYIFGDHGSQNIWSLNHNTNEVVLLTSIPEFGEGSKKGISSFATNNEGDIFVLKLYGHNKDGGIIYKLELDDTPVEPIPTLLSQTGAFSDLINLTPASGIIPYDVNAALWSDDSEKQRWVAIPNDGTHDSPEEQIVFFEKDEWIFPNGTVFIKHFEIPTDKNEPTIIKRLETRFFIMEENGRGYGLTYKWNEEGTDAVLLETGEEESFEVFDENGQAHTQVWEYPSRVQCMNCHNPNAGFVLGVKTWHLNGDLKYPSSGITSNQLATWNHLGIFANPIDENEIPNMIKSFSLTAETSLSNRVSSYLDANCSYCHLPNGVDGAFDARYTTPMNYKNIVNAQGVSHNTISGQLIVKAADPHNSELWIRDSSVDENKMPPLAKSTIDEVYIDVLTKWIEGLNTDCNGNFLSDFNWETEPENGFGPVELNLSNGENKKNDGDSLSIGGKRFIKGLGTHAYSEITYTLDQNYHTFSSFIGVDDESCDKASLQFEVYADDVLKYQSPIMYKGEDARFISVDIVNVDQLKLIVHSPEDEIDCDHGDWAQAKILRGEDSDGDGICDQFDICAGADDNIDENYDGIPDGCEAVKEGGVIEIKVQPNPFTDYVELYLEKPDPLIQKAKLVVYDLNGRIMYQDFNVAYDSYYRMGQSWEPGLYIVFVKAGAFNNRIKVIKHK